MKSGGLSPAILKKSSLSPQTSSGARDDRILQHIDCSTELMPDNFF